MAVDVAGPPSEVSMAATPPLFLALFFLFRFFAMAARRDLLVQVQGARVSRGFGGGDLGGRKCLLEAGNTHDNLGWEL